MKKMIFGGENKLTTQGSGMVVMKRMKVGGIAVDEKLIGW